MFHYLWMPKELSIELGKHPLTVYSLAGERRCSIQIA